LWPEFPGGQVALMRYLNHHIQYPPIARENAIEGRVICKFIIEKDGSISDVQVVRGVEPSLDREAVRVIESMPRWIPGQHHTEIVRVRFTMPVIFRLS
ncbi:MAG TPA: energy transducer TonB, partial [Porphyromonadaceae bacterium]|nr:energy transducer TonB [Porphyromonadaceae bacterium]